MIKATRSESTESKYNDRAIKLCCKALIEANKAKAQTEKHTREYLINNKTCVGLSVLATAKWAAAKWSPHLLSSTWRYYRSSLIFFAQKEFNAGRIHSNSTIDRIEKILKDDSLKNSKHKKNTSSLKRKSISDTDLELLFKQLSVSRSKVSGFLSVWLYANCIVGLRPCEWATSSLVDRNGISLKITNAKNTNGRSHGEFRYINISSFTKNQISRIVSFTEACQKLEEAGVFYANYESCRKLLQRTSRKLWPKRKQHVTLYTTRHQFSADLKKSGKKLEEIAYLMGHTSTDTATSHYGKRRNGRNKVTPDVPSSDLKTITSKYKTFTFNKNQKTRTL